MCGGNFDSEEAYIAHECPKTGFTPADNEHQGEGFSNISRRAQERAEAKKEDAKDDKEGK